MDGFPRTACFPAGQRRMVGACNPIPASLKIVYSATSAVDNPGERREVSGSNPPGTTGVAGLYLVTAAVLASANETFDRLLTYLGRKPRTRLHVREEARLHFAPPFHFRPEIATQLACSNKDPPTPRTRVGQKGRLLPHEAPFPLPAPEKRERPSIGRPAGPSKVAKSKIARRQSVDGTPLMAWRDNRQSRNPLTINEVHRDRCAPVRQLCSSRCSRCWTFPPPVSCS